jgi:potassium-transporting ATPase KdpC subunit
MRAQVRPALGALLFLTLLTGLAYPAAITAVAQALFPRQANGSLILRQGRVVGSELIGQHFDDPAYFWGRPSATGGFPYDAFSAAYRTGSSGSNYGPLNPALAASARDRAQALRDADPNHAGLIPVDLLTASASGLDPDISPAAAFYQVPRVARARGLSELAVRALVEQHIQKRQFWFLGEPTVNVLELNLALDGLQ